MNLVKVGKRLGTGALVAAAVLAPTAAHAIDAPYAQAAAIVLKDGTLHFDKNIESVRRVGTGRYCVKVDRVVDVTNKTPVQATARTGARAISAFNWKSPVCNSEDNTVIVYTYNLEGHGADSDFYLTIP
ncbi:hypothetical protein FAF44_02380 [Nonomuraea sp. MG754425]|uniref:hypothetical protein n=1 Tax=Nonomuraea sp. MG754425 TaxID=2570319 RepID=UPI001F3E1859|nr:hypothetical protein [Nonomuraea sp. MG754425]MCF6467259.1 hypothetical protein [Nonomuraea sp. MG754425]